MNELPISKETKVIVTDQSGKSREGTVINHDNGRYLVRFPDTSMSEFWSPEFVRKK
jgi:hypothetical protein